MAGSYSVSADGRTINFLPSAPLAVERTYFVAFTSRGITDLAGNFLTCQFFCNFFFTTGATASTTTPGVVGLSPADGLTAVPTNAQVVVQFSEPVDGLTTNQVTLSGGGTAVNVISTLSNANQTLTLAPVVPLNANTTYTVDVTGVQDLSGNVYCGIHFKDGDLFGQETGRKVGRLTWQKAQALFKGETFTAQN